ncbi:MAG: tetratricopeptide repeat protein [Chloroflexi bacterium]|nr:tetratricopeptide repeat protein [Chloroflexota bacterium]
MSQSSSQTGCGKQIIAVLIATITALAAIIAFLQADAAQRDDRANRDSKRYALEAFGRKVSGDARVNYDYNKAYQQWYELGILADSATKRGEPDAARRYTALRDKIVKLSPLLAPPYFDRAKGDLNVAKYEAETYLVEITELTEKFKAATAVKEAWDYKANTYIIHLTLLAVALFLLGMAGLISGAAARVIFSATGIVVTFVAIGWAGILLIQPVPDLRERGAAIPAYARGIGLAHQGLHKPAIAEFDRAIQAAPDYTSALVDRADTYAELGDYAAAVPSYERARALDAKSAHIAGNLAWSYYMLGRLDNAIDLNRAALEENPNEGWIRFNLALALLASGKSSDASATYVEGMNAAANQVADAKSAGKEPPYNLWWALDTAAIDLDDLLQVIATGTGEPPRAKIANADLARPIAQSLIAQLKGLAVALEYTGKPPVGSLTAKIGAFTFGEPEYDAKGNITDYAEDTEFEYGTVEIAALFDYAGMKKGDQVIFKVYINGAEDPSWRLIVPWELDATGAAHRLMSPGYTDTFVFDPGEYAIELYINSHFAQRGKFRVK